MLKLALIIFETHLENAIQQNTTAIKYIFDKGS